MSRAVRVLAVASGGGHWQQLMLLRDALAYFDTTYLTTDAGMAKRAGLSLTPCVMDCSREQPLRALWCFAQVFAVMVKTRPDVVISTGALPGAMALIIGKMFGARTIWIDSIANAESMSSSARATRKFSDLWLSQWEDVAAASGALWRGAVV